MAGEIKLLEFSEGVSVTPSFLSGAYTEDDAVTWDGTGTTKVYDVSATIADATLLQWDFLDVSNGYKRIDGAVITRTTTTVTVTFTIPPAAGTYRLLGVQ